jgi:hypothetical protein
MVALNVLPCALRRIHTFSWCKVSVFGGTLDVYTGEAKMNSWVDGMGWDDWEDRSIYRGIKVILVFEHA